jgi:hypothetical protein
LKTLFEEVKEKLQNMNQAASSTPETAIPPGFPIWDQYNHNYIDSISSKKRDTNLLRHGQPDPERQPASVDEFWLKTLFEGVKEKLQNMNQAASSTPETSIPPGFPIWDEYDHKYIDPSISRTKKTDTTTTIATLHDRMDDRETTPASTTNKIWLETVLEEDKEKLQNIEIWLETVLEEDKEKLQNMNQGASSTPDTSIPLGFPIWDQYNHDYIDPMSPHKMHHNHTANLHHGQSMEEFSETLTSMAEDDFCG